jgi:hypothetical protein
MVLGVLGVQSQALARFDGRLNVGAVSARLDDGRKPAETQVVKEIWQYWVGENPFGVPLRQTARVVRSAKATARPVHAP